MPLTRLLGRLLAATLLLPTLTAFSAPNIIFILTDDLGHGDVGVFFQNARKARNERSEPWHLTPQLDTLAGEGIQLPRHYCPAPVCAPSRASLLLGVHQGHSNVRDNQFDKALENNHTLATMLKQAGYATAAIGKWGLQGKGGSPETWPAYPTRRGFDYYFGYVRHRDGHEHYPKEGKHRGSKECYDGVKNITPDLDKCYTTDLFTARAKRWIVEQHESKPEQPIFLYLAYDTPHAVLELPTGAYPAGGGTNGGVQWLGTPGKMINTAEGTIDSYYHPDYANATWDHDKNPATAEAPWPDVYKRYATSVRRIDDCVGDLLTLFKQLGTETNTLVVFTSDNGPSKESYLAEDYDPTFFNSFGPHDGIKRDTWEGGIRVGALARWTGKIAAGRVNAIPCGAWDWMPTFAEAAGVPAPARTDGVSLMPTLTGLGKQRAPLVYVEYFENGTTPKYEEFDASHAGRRRGQMQVLFAENHKGIRYNVTSADTDFEIYDVQADPKETRNLAGDAKFAGLQKRLKERALQVRRPDDSAPRPYDAAFVSPATNSAIPMTGVSYKTYAGRWAWVPEFAAMQAGSTGTVDGFDLKVRPQDTDFGIAFEGHFNIPAEGNYTFHVKSDSGAHLRIHEATVIDDDFARSGSERSGEIRLQKGLHPFRLYYKHASGPMLLEVTFSSPELPRQAVPVGLKQTASVEKKSAEAGAVAAAALPAGAKKPAAGKPNILWLIAEDFGPALGCYGQTGVETPNLDRLAREGARYEHFYSTAPVCSPSRSAFMTGMYQTTIGAHQHRTPNKQPLPAGVKVLPDWMREAGYFTGNLRVLPETVGFKGTGKTDWNFIAPEKLFDTDSWEDLKARQPFFAQINFHETHRKFNGERKADPASVPLPPYYPDHPIAREDYARYLDATMELDRKVGLILNQLEEDGLAENTVVVFMGDNGEAHVRGKQFCYEEGLHVPLIIRWPRGFAAPEQFRAGSVDTRLLEAIDLAPTFLAIAGAEIPPKMQGRPFLGKKAGADKQYVFGARDRCDETAMRIRSVRDSRFRYIRNFTPEVPLLAPNDYKEKQYPMWNLLKELNAAGKLTPEQAALCAPRLPSEELYDMEADPHQVRNLAASPDLNHKVALKRMRTVLNQWIRDTNDQGEKFEAIPASSSEAKTRKKRKRT